MSTKTKKILYAVGAGIILAAIIIGFIRFSKKEDFSFFAPSQKKEKEAYSILDGRSVPEKNAFRNPLAIVIENHPDSRPQSGLESASIIYEVLTEGGITRFLAIFSPYDGEKIGPVRSARDFFLDWVEEFDAFFAHVGGSPKALAEIRQKNIKDLDQFVLGEQAYWRERWQRKAIEHTVFTSTHNLYSQAERRGWSITASLSPYQFKEDLPQAQRPVSNEITIQFSSPEYEVNWDYDQKNNWYLRNMAGSPHKDGLSGNQLVAKNLIIAEMERTPVLSEGENQIWKVKTLGVGKAMIFIDGKEISGTWMKSSPKERTIFFDNNGNQIRFNRGVFWIEVIPPGTKISTQ